MFIKEKASIETEPSAHVQRWEYKALNLNYKMSVSFEGEFNKLGRQGWEFVAMIERDKMHRAIFKRQL